jgi:hypothetical protein
MNEWPKIVPRKQVMVDEFPTYGMPEKARCFSCKARLSHVKPSGYAPFHGAWQGYCYDCAMSTWFDVVEPLLRAS